MVSKILALVLFVAATINAAPQPSSTSTDVNRNNNCEVLLTQCERITHDLRKQRVRAEAACLKLKFQLWRLETQHAKLGHDIESLRSQIEQRRPDPTMARQEFNKQRPISMEMLVGANANCTIRLGFCEDSQEWQRYALRNINAEMTNCSSRIEEQTRANNQLNATKTSLVNQVVAQGMIPYAIADPENPSSAEYDIDDAEVERRVAASVVTPAPHPIIVALTNEHI